MWGGCCGHHHRSPAMLRSGAILKLKYNLESYSEGATASNLIDLTTLTTESFEDLILSRGLGSEAHCLGDRLAPSDGLLLQIL